MANQYRNFDPKKIEIPVFCRFNENFPFRTDGSNDYALWYYGHGGINASNRDTIRETKLRDIPLHVSREFSDAIIVYHIYPDTYAHFLVEILPDIVQFVHFRNNTLSKDIPIIAPCFARSCLDETVLRYFKDNNVLLKSNNETWFIKRNSWMNIDQHPLMNYNAQSLVTREIYQELYDCPPVFNFEKIYIDRTPKDCINQHRFVLNRKELFDLIIPMGFKIIDTARMSRFEQINVFKYANTILTVHGSAETNILYCQPGTTIKEINIRENWPYFRDIAARCELNHHSLVTGFGFGENLTLNIEAVNQLILR